MAAGAFDDVVLDRPQLENRQARYGPRHLLQLLAVKALQAMNLPLAEIQQRLYARSDQELSALVDSLSTQLRKRAPAPELKSLGLREVILEPGLRLVVEDGWSPRDAAALEQRIRAAVAALSGGKT